MPKANAVEELSRRLFAVRSVLAIAQVELEGLVRELRATGEPGESRLTPHLEAVDLVTQETILSLDAQVLELHRAGGLNDITLRTIAFGTPEAA